MRWERGGGTSTGKDPAVSNTFPPQELCRHGWADLLRLVDDVRRLAYDRTPDDADRPRRIRDRFGEYDGMFDDDRCGEPRVGGDYASAAQTASNTDMSPSTNASRNGCCPARDSSVPSAPNTTRPEVASTFWCVSGSV